MDFATLVGFSETYTPLHIIAIRLILAALFGAAMGYEREKNSAAGLRTHILIATAACLFAMLALELMHVTGIAEQGQADPIRAIEAVTAGIAFLGAGAIFQQRGNVQGLTTGAGMWLAGAIGVATALGYYLVALAATVLAVIVIAILRGLGKRLAGREPSHEEDEERSHP